MYFFSPGSFSLDSTQKQLKYIRQFKLIMLCFKAYMTQISLFSAIYVFLFCFETRSCHVPSLIVTNPYFSLSSSWYNRTSTIQGSRSFYLDKISLICLILKVQMHTIISRLTASSFPNKKVL